MKILHYPLITSKKILALGGESSGNFTVYKNGWIYFSPDFGDLLNEKKWENYQKNLFAFLKNNDIKPEIILCDLHPDFKTTLFAKKLAQKYKSNLIQVQHHLAHIFSAFGEDEIRENKDKKEFISIAMDGTGLGLDGKIWGGEVFKVTSNKVTGNRATRIGHLENQPMIGGELAIKEPARMLVGILSKFLNKDEIYGFVKKHYNLKEFELIYSQLKENFNCLETSSAGRILDAVSILLGFSKNERLFKHQAAKLLEKNSSIPFENINISISKSNVLEITPLFEYLIKNINKDKKRLSATSQLYLAKGLSQIALKDQKLPIYPHTKKEIGKNFGVGVYFAGGITNNKIISEYFLSQGFVENTEIPKGDAGLSFGQLMYYMNK